MLFLIVLTGDTLRRKAPFFFDFRFLGELVAKNTFLCRFLCDWIYSKDFFRVKKSCFVEIGNLEFCLEDMVEGYFITVKLVLAYDKVLS